MTTYTFVGDIHGKVEQVEKALAMPGQKIFVGDFMDSFDRPPSDHRRCLRLVLDAIGAGDAQAIYGNHELSYLLPFHQCSGWTRENLATMNEMGGEIVAKFRPYILLNPKFLVSHAGLTRQLWELPLKELEARLAEWWLDRWSPAHYIGRVRGGDDPVGGLFWCDFVNEFKPIPGLTQVFGHTRMGEEGGIRKVKNSYCIDCLDGKAEFLTLDLP